MKLLLSVLVILASSLLFVNGSMHYLYQEKLVQEQALLVEVGGKVWEAPEYRADSGGCAPLTDWANYYKDTKWFQWGRRVKPLALKVHQLNDHGEYMRATFNALGGNMWMQMIDGWTHPKGRNSFGSHYVDDLTTASNYAASQFGKKRWLNVDTYTQIHQLSFSQDATKLEKRNGYRLENSGIYLPVPDKPLGVFHDIMMNGAINFDPNLRKVDKSPVQNEKGPVWKYNGGWLYRWVYPGVSEAQGRTIVQRYFDDAWDAIEKADQFDYDTKLNVVVQLYHNLENFHCFVDGNGRTNYVVLQSMLCEIGLHPVLLYNLMESALGSVQEERQKVIEGFYKWEEAYTTGQSGWSISAIEARGKECEVAIGQLMGTVPANGAVVPDTLGGCMCQDASTCETNPLTDGKQWCTADNKCIWTWDICAPGRSSKKSF